MYRILVFVLILVLSGASFGLTREEIQIGKLNREIKALEMRQARAKRMEHAKLQRQIMLLRKQLAELTAPSVAPAPFKKPFVKQPLAQQPKRRFISPLELGLSLGLLSNIPGAYAELRWHSPLDIQQAAVKTGLMYAQGNDDNKVLRKYALLFADGLFELNSMDASQIGTYLGGGVNYLVYTTGKVSGGVGGQAYFGLQSRIDRSQVIYAELGYGAFRTGISPTQKGLIATVGMRGAL